MSKSTTPEERARRRVEEYRGLMWHAAAYVVVNAFLWALDLVTGGGLEWAYWTTIPWGLGLLFHTASYMIDSGRLTERKYEKFLAEEQHRDSSDRASGSV